MEKKDYYALSSAQRRIYLLQQLAPQSTVYNMSQVIPLADGFSIHRLERAFVRLIERHESLRTSFESIAGEPVQRVHDHVEFGIEYDERTEDREPLPGIIRPFDLSRAPLMRVVLIEIETLKNTHFLVVDVHHIVSDGVSHEILQGDFMALYQGETLSPLEIQYKEFAHWQNSEKQKGHLKRQEAYWLRLFEGEIPVLNLPTDYPRPRVQSFEGGMVADEISCDINALKTIALENGATTFMVLLAAFYIFLSRVTGAEADNGPYMPITFCKSA